MPEHKNLVIFDGRWRVEMYVLEEVTSFQLAFVLHQNKQDPVLSNMFVETELSENISHRTEA